MRREIRKSVKWGPGPQKTIKEDQKTIKNGQKQSQKAQKWRGAGRAGGGLRKRHFCAFWDCF